ncbi:MAG: NAD(P)/FAD-dependent oxidoreductase [Leeuwenhoekiella sp.]
MQKAFDVLILGGGAAGFFTAINLAESSPSLKIAILEKSAAGLAKVKVSGGGRCNVTHAEFLPKPLSTKYPRGERELLGPFHKFMTGDTMRWFEERGVALKIEEDGRIFPESDSSQTIIDCFLSEIDQLGINFLPKQSVNNFIRENELWEVETTSETFRCKSLIVTTGSSSKIWEVLANLGHTIIPPVPSLFTFNIKDERISGLPGIATPATVSLLDLNRNYLKNKRGNRLDEGSLRGPLLITHWGLSGPAVLKASAIAARKLHELDYNFFIEINWLPDWDFASISEKLDALKLDFAKKAVFNTNPFTLPRRLWTSLIASVGIDPKKRWADLDRNTMDTIGQVLYRSHFRVSGKSTFKEEFVTAGGVSLKDVDFQTFGSKKQKHLYFAGEVLNIDAVTGGFNFQNAWTGGFLVAKAISQNNGTPS